MDIEAAKDDLSLEDGQLVVFDKIEYSVPKGIQRKYKCRMLSSIVYSICKYFISFDVYYVLSRVTQVEN